jgi:hypothetical protein
MSRVFWLLLLKYSGMWSIAKLGSRFVLGERLYVSLRERFSTPKPALQVQQLRTLLLDVRAQFKSHVLRSLSRQRALEKELAQLKYPSLYRQDLDVTVEIVRKGEMPSGSADSISVVITNYNYGQYLPEAIESVLAQTHGEVEVVVVDDASTDGSTDELERLLDRAGAIPSSRALLKHNIGLPGARNLGVRLARGEFVFMLDADNRLLVDCLERHVRMARSTGSDATYAIIRVFGHGSLRPQFLSDAPFDVKRLSTKNYIDSMALFRRTALLEAGLYSTELVLYGVEDYELWLRFAAQRRRVEFIPTVLSEYRIHGQNMLPVAVLDLRGGIAHLRSKYPDIFSNAPVEVL